MSQKEHKFQIAYILRCLEKMFPFFSSYIFQQKKNENKEHKKT